MRRYVYSSIRQKLMVWFLLVSLLPLIGTAIFTYRVNSQELIDKQTSSRIDLVSTTAQGMEQWLDNRMGELQLSAKTAIMKSNNPEDQTVLVKTIRNHADIYEAVFFTPGSGRATAHSEGRVGLNVATRDYFINGMKGKSSFSEVVVSKGTGNKIVVLATPVKSDSGNIMGVLSASMNFQMFVDKFLGEFTSSSRKGTAILVDEKGQIQAHPNKKIVGKKIEESGLAPDLANILKRKIKEPGSALYNDGEKETLIVYAPIKNIGYGLYLTIPKDTILEASKRINTSVLAIIIGASLFVILTAFFIARNISRPIEQVTDAVQRVASGDLTVEPLKIKQRDEVGMLGEGFNAMLEHIRKVVFQVNVHSEQVATSARELAANMEQTGKATEHITISVQELAAGADKQAYSVKESSHMIQEMLNKFEQISGYTKNVTSSVNQTSILTTEGSKAIQSAMAKMNSLGITIQRLSNMIEGLGNQSKEIGQITEVITNLAAQTNLLALNAAIEAARAGEHGQGFSVVANEVRKLAEQSTNSAQQITNIIRTIQEETSKATAVMEESSREVTAGIEGVNVAGENFERIQQSINDVAQEAQGAAEAVQQLSEESHQVVHAIQEIAYIAESTLSGVQNISAASEQQLASIEEVSSFTSALSTMAEELQKSIREFKLQESSMESPKF
jgi:methyl-accepting chemotaxis protein